MDVRPLIDVDVRLILNNLLHAVAAFALALPVAWNRERSEAGLGLRTFPLVALASCGYILVARSVPGMTPDAEARVIQGLLTGIGFVGGGAILKEGGTVRGTATAASIWNTGAIGMAVAYDRLEIALVLSTINFATLRWLTLLKDRAAPGADGDRDGDGAPRR
jgi:putative Mg2+ transporter-C (MgtC) family protein